MELICCCYFVVGWIKVWKKKFFNWLSAVHQTAHQTAHSDTIEWYLNTMWKIFGQMKYQKGKEEKVVHTRIIIIENWKWAISFRSPVLLNIRRWTLTRYFSGRREWKLHSCVRGMLLKKIWNESLKGEENWENTKIENQEFQGACYSGYG